MKKEVIVITIKESFFCIHQHLEKILIENCCDIQISLGFSYFKYCIKYFLLTYYKLYYNFFYYDVFHPKIPFLKFIFWIFPLQPLHFLLIHLFLPLQSRFNTHILSQKEVSFSLDKSIHNKINRISKRHHFII